MPIDLFGTRIVSLVSGSSSHHGLQPLGQVHQAHALGSVGTVKGVADHHTAQVCPILEESVQEVQKSFQVIGGIAFRPGAIRFDQAFAFGWRHPIVLLHPAHVCGRQSPILHLDTQCPSFWGHILHSVQTLPDGELLSVSSFLRQQKTSVAFVCGYRLHRCEHRSRKEREVLMCPCQGADQGGAEAALCKRECLTQVGEACRVCPPFRP